MKNVPTLKLLMVERVTQKRCTNFNLFPSPSPWRPSLLYTHFTIHINVIERAGINKFP